MAKAKRRSVRGTRGLRGTTGRQLKRSVERGIEAQDAKARKRGEALGLTLSEASVGETDILDEEL